MILGWLLALASGALATSLIRVPVGIAGIGSTALLVHIGLGAALGILALWRLWRAGQGSRIGAAAAVIATLALGWFARRSFAPATAAAHAAVGAIATAVLAATGSAVSFRPPTAKRGSWKFRVASAGFVLLGIQVVLGALLRHQLVSLSWHLLGAGLAAACILGAAVAVAQDSRATDVEKRASTWAITSVLVQAGLGVAILIMMMIGTAHADVWLLTTVTHVVVASVTLLAAGKLTRVLHESLRADCSAGDGRS